ncbi:hypothetical protein JOM56_014424 [Amanita muscaria]
MHNMNGPRMCTNGPLVPMHCLRTSCVTCVDSICGIDDQFSISRNVLWSSPVARVGRTGLSPPGPSPDPVREVLTWTLDSVTPFDITLGGMEATELIQSYEKQHALPRTPIIALTTHASSYLVVHFLSIHTNTRTLTTVYKQEDDHITSSGPQTKSSLSGRMCELKRL